MDYFTGLNAGIMLMNLEAMRKVYFQNAMLLVYKGFKERLRWADQDVMNVYFQFHENAIDQYILSNCWSEGFTICDFVYRLAA